MAVVSRRPLCAAVCALGLVVLSVAGISGPAHAASPSPRRVTPKGVPEAVRDLAAIPTKTSVSIGWKVPNGKNAATRYRVYQSKTTTFGAAIATVTKTSYTATDVSSGTGYYFAVRAENGDGLGRSSATRDPVSVGAPGSVSQLTATASSNTAVALSWNPPVLTGAVPITGYVIEMVKYGQLTTLDTIAAKKTTYTATALTDSTAYVFIVEATNGDGTGPGSDVTGQTMTPTPLTAATGWSQLSPATSPPDENGAAIGYDAASGQVVMFGGFGSDGDTNRTWTWDGSTWTQHVTDITPPAADGALMAYDPATRQLLMFGGGQAGFNFSSQTWSWNGANWRLLNPAHSPPAGGDGAMAYDAATRQMILYGGISSTGCVKTTWEWSGADWTQLSPKAHPDACSSPAMAYDEATGQLVLFGGYNDQGGIDNTTWDWTGTTWAQLTTTPAVTPAGVAYASLGYSELAHELVLTGGFDTHGTDQSSSWIWNGTRWVASTASGPPAGDNAAIAYDAASAQLILLGGTGAQATTWSWGDPPRLGLLWDLKSGVGPSPRDGQEMVYDPATSELILFGGEDQSGAKLDDTWAWSKNVWTRLHPSTSPPARAYAAMAYDDATGQLILFGGKGASGDLDDTWDWTGTTWQALKPSQLPRRRDKAAIAYDEATGQLIMFGGSGSSGTQGFAETWNWTGKTWTELTTSPTPPDAGGGGLVFDPNAGVLVLTTPSVPQSWTWNGLAWSQPDSPVQNHSDAFTYYPYTGKLVGIDDYSGTTGLGVPITGVGQPVLAPPVRIDASISFDPASGQTVVFGGLVDATEIVGLNRTKLVPVAYGDTWVQNPKPSPPQAPTDVAAKGAESEIDLSWEAPSNDGGAQVNGYNVYEGTASGAESPTPINSSPVSADATSYDVAGLATAKVYYFTVVAINSIGESPASAEATTSTYSAPTPPVSLTAVAGDTTATLSWSPPTNDGGPAVTGYNVYQGIGDGSESSMPVNSSPLAPDATSLQVTGLTDAVSYNFTVVAINEIGSSAASNEIFGVEPFTLPGAPAAGVLVGNSQLELTWSSPPGSDNGQAISAYNVYEGTSPGGESVQPVNASPIAGSATSLLVNGLTNGTTYYFTVTQSNSAGASPASTEVSATPALVPSTITDLTAKSSSTGLELTWQPGIPILGVSAVTGYNVYEGDQAGSESATPINASPLPASADSYNPAGLPAGTTRFFMVEAVNTVGPSLPSNQAHGALEIVPSAVPSVRALAESGKATLTWGAPLETGGTPITAYDIYQSTRNTTPGKVVDTTSGTSAGDVITGLTNGTKYYFTVRAVNAVGLSTAANSDKATASPVGPPDAPVGSASPATTSVTLTWTDSNNGGAAITGYTISGAKVGDSFPPYSLGSTTLPATPTKLNVGDLKRGTTYDFRLTATNKYGTSAVGKIRVTTNN
jgi:fibronectin type 3 domain-containing protein